MNLEQVKQIMTKYDLTGIEKDLHKRLDTPTIKLGFIGPFSAGKTTLINTLLGTKLPVDIKPTTKAICIIESKSDIATNKYYRDFEGTREEVDFLTLCDIINGDDKGDAVVQLPCTDSMPEGVVYIDTPGVDSMGQAEAELTYSYLAMMDAAVVCISAEDGTLKKSVADFICSPMLKPFASNLVFVLTKSDLKTSEAIESIKAEVVKQLEALCEAGKLPIKDVANRVIAVSKEDANARLSKFLSEHLSKDLAKLQRARTEREAKDIAGSIVEILRERRDALALDDSQYDAKIEEAKSQLRKLENEEREKKDQFNDFEFELRSRLYDAMFAYEARIANSTNDEQTKTAIDEMTADTCDVARRFCEEHVNDISLGASVMGDLDVRMAEKMKNIERVRNLSVMVTTAVATAWIAPGATAAANAAEAAGGAAGQQVAAKTAQKVAVEAAKKAATIGEVLVEGARKRAENKPSFLTKALVGLAEVVKDINPLETIGDIAVEKAKAASFKTFVQTYSSKIASRVISELRGPYEREVIAPLRLHLEEVERGLQEQKRLRHEDAARIRTLHCEMLSDIAVLEKFVSEA